MSQMVVLLAPTVRAARLAAAQRVSSPEGTVVLGNARGIARGWRAAFLAAGSAQGCRLPRFATLGDWFLEAATLAAAPNWSTRADRRFLLRSILPFLRPQLQVLHRLCRSNDLVRQLDLLIGDLRHAGHESFAFTGDWSDDLHLIVGEYNRRLHERGAIDTECAPATWLQNQSLFDAPDISCVVFDQLLAPSPVEWRGMNRLCAQAGSTLVSLAMPWLDGASRGWESVLAQAENSALERILWLWRDAGAQLEIIAPEPEVAPRQKAVCDLLAYRQVEAPPNCDLTAAHSPRDEMERVASHLRSQCAAPEMLGEYALVLPDAATYAGVLEPSFAAHGVPIHTRRARPHASYPLVARVLRLLQLHDSDWSLDAIADVFGDGLLRLGRDDDSESELDIHRLRAACFKARLDSLRDENDCLARLTQIIDERETIDPEIAGDVACIARLREAVARLNAANHAGEWQQEIFAIIELTLGHLWRGAQSTPWQAQAMLQVEALLDAVGNLVLRFDRWQPKFMARKNREANAFSDFAFDCLRLELESTTIPLEEKTGAALEVISPLQLQNDVPREVYFAGLVEGAWPASGAPGTLLARHQRELAPLRAHHVEPTQLARYQVALALVEADAVHLLHPLQNSGREVLRSALLEDIALCWKNTRELERPPLPSSRGALLSQLGRHFQAGGLQLLESQLSSSWREALRGAAVDEKQLRNLLRIERERSSAQTLGVYDGTLGESGARLLREIERLAGREELPLQLSATRLKTYAQCPLRFFVRHILNLKPLVSLQDELRGDRSGELVHDIIERFAKGYGQPLTPENQGEAWFVLRGIALHEIEQLALRPLLREVEARRLLGTLLREPGGLLGKMLLAEIAQRSGSEQKPAFAAPLIPLAESEVRLPPVFQEGAELELPLRLGNLKVDGRIDRILVARDGKSLAVVDYKTERPEGLPKFTHVNWGFDFQLALYLLAVRSHLRLWQETTGSSTLIPRLVAAFFTMRNGTWVNGFGESGTMGRNQTQKGPGAICHANGVELDAETFHHWLDEIEARICGVGDFVQRAQFNITIQDEAVAGCQFCDFQAACRYNAAVADARLNAAYGAPSRASRELYLPLPILPEEKKAGRSLPA